MKKHLFTVLKSLAFLGLGVLLVWLSLRGMTDQQMAELIDAIYNAGWGWAFLSIVFGILSHLSRSIRWNMLLEPLGYKPKVYNSFFAVMVGYFANLAVWRMGEVMRCGIMYRYEKIPVDKSLATVVTERVIDMLMLLIMMAITLLTQYSIIWNYMSQDVFPSINEKIEGLIPGASIGIILIAVALAGLVIGLLILRSIRHTAFYAKLKNFVKGFIDGLRSIGKLKNPWMFVGHTIFIWVMYYLMLYVVLFAFAETSNAGAGAALSAFVLGGLAMIATPGGIGAYPLAMREILLPYGIGLTTGYAFGWVVWGAQTTMIVIVGVLSLILLPLLNQKHDPAGTDTAEDTNA